MNYRNKSGNGYSHGGTQNKQPLSKKNFIKIGVIMLIAGLAFGIASIFIYRYEKNFIENGVKTEAVIVAIEVYYDNDDDETASHNVYVEYEAGGKKLTNKLNTYVSGMKVGQTVPIRYLPDDPNKISYAKVEYLFVIIFAPISLSLITASAIAFVFAAKKSN